LKQLFLLGIAQQQTQQSVQDAKTTNMNLQILKVVMMGIMLMEMDVLKPVQ